MQGDDGLPGAGAAVDHEGAGRSGADDRVLVGLDGAEHVAHPGRPVRAETRDERGLVVECRGVPGEPLGGEDLVPVVGDPATGPPVAAPAGQTHRVAVGRAEERLGRGGAPVEQQPAARAVGETEPPDVDGLAVPGADDVAEAEVQAEAPQGAQAGGQPVDLQVAVECLLPDAAGRPAFGVEAFGEVGDRLGEALGEGGEELLVAGDQRRIGLVGEGVGKVEGAGDEGRHGISSDQRAATLERNFCPHEKARNLLQRRRGVPHSGAKTQNSLPSGSASTSHSISSSRIRTGRVDDRDRPLDRARMRPAAGARRELASGGGQRVFISRRGSGGRARRGRGP